MLVCDICLMWLCVVVCVVLSGVFVYACGCGVCVLLMCPCVGCEDCVMSYGVLLLAWCLCL